MVLKKILESVKNSFELIMTKIVVILLYRHHVEMELESVDQWKPIYTWLETNDDVEWFIDFEAFFEGRLRLFFRTSHGRLKFMMRWL